MMTKSFRCVALDDPDVVETLTSDISGDISNRGRNPTVNIGGRSFAINPPNLEFVRKLARRHCIATVPATRATSPTASVGLTDEELEFASETEFSQSAASQFARVVGDATFASWMEEDAAEARRAEREAEQRAAYFRARELSRYITAIGRHYPGVARDLSRLSQLPMNELDAAQADRVLLAAGATLNELGISF
jgi:hypothetical protein